MTRLSLKAKLAETQPYLEPLAKRVENAVREMFWPIEGCAEGSLYVPGGRPDRAEGPLYAPGSKPLLDNLLASVSILPGRNPDKRSPETASP